MIAGPSEVLVLADDSANPEWLAADMLSQAEHDALASAICITDNEALAHAVIAELERQSATLPRADIVRKSLADWSAVVLVPDMDAAHAKHAAMGCICFENPGMGIYFIEDPDGYWIEIVPEK